MVDKDMLVVRSVGFQQLDQNLPRLQETFADHRITLLTHQHGLRLAEKYKPIRSVCVYPFKEGFHFFRRVKELEHKTFDAVIIPVSNLTGTGFFNVLLFSLTVRARKRFVCNMVSEIREITPLHILGMGIKNAVFTVAAGLLAGLFGLFTWLFLPVLLKRLLKHKRGS